MLLFVSDVKIRKFGGNSAGFLRISAVDRYPDPAAMGSLRRRTDVAGVYVPGCPFGHESGGRKFSFPGWVELRQGVEKGTFPGSGGVLYRKDSDRIFSGVSGIFFEIFLPEFFFA